MKKTYDIVEKRMVDFRDACERQGLKATHQRLEIYRELASTEEYPDVEMIFQGMA